MPPLLRRSATSPEDADLPASFADFAFARFAGSNAQLQGLPGNPQYSVLLAPF